MKTNKQFRTEILNQVKQWLTTKYNLDNDARTRIRIAIFNYADINWSTTCRFSYFRKVRDSKGRLIRIDMERRFWLTYKRKTIGVYANQIRCTEKESLALQLTHELTHYIQYLQGRRYSEVETTRNELEYAKQHFPYLYEKLEPIK